MTGGSGDSRTTSLIRYEAAREALAEALRVDEVMEVRNFAERMKLYARQSKDRKMIADAAALQLRAERKLGVLIVSAKESGQLGIGRPKNSNLSAASSPSGPGQTVEDDDEDENGSEPEPFTRTTLSEAGIDKKLSSKAQAWARMGDADFELKLVEIRERIESTGATIVNPAKDMTTADKKAKRQEREAALGKKLMALPEAKFGVIYADPEWRFEVRSDKGMDRAADNHYPTSDIEAIKARDVGSLAAGDCVMFLWATAPMLPQALEVMAAWGFSYKAQAVWVKVRPGAGRGTGYWFLGEHELLLVGTRGEVPCPAPGTQWRSVIEAPVGKHSEKPEKFYELIESYFPTLPKIELNARQAREGWARWGYEAPDEAQKMRDGEMPPEQLHGEKPAVNGGAVASSETAKAGEAIPSTSPAPISLAERDAVIAEVYGRDGLPDFAEIERRTGLDKVRARKRAYQLGLSSRERQRQAASEYTRGQHEARAAAGAEDARRRASEGEQ